MMPGKDDRDFDALEEALAADFAENASRAEIEQALEARGIDPGRLAARAGELAERAGEPAWQRRARERLAAARRRIGKVASEYADLGREALLERLEALRVHPSLATPARAAFRKRSPEESSDEELRELLADMESLVAIVEAEGEPGEPGEEE